MDFFEEQDQSRKQSRLLLLCFALAALSMILLAYVLLLVFVQLNPLDEARKWVFTGEAISLVVLLMLLFITSGTAFSFWFLRKGGESVIKLLRGLAIDPQTRDPDERCLLNVVEEMAIASGIPAPPVYLLKFQPSINAFAAGYAPEDAVIGVTAGTLKLLKRDEMQGVVAHEFSHIFNGDMRLNFTATALLHGLSLFWNIGRKMIADRSISAEALSDVAQRRIGGELASLLVGSLLMVIGFPGFFFGRIIRATLSQERELLADAAAVQFTRNPAGLAGALKKIGGLREAGKITSVYAGVLNHFFFASAEDTAPSSIFATHPPLEQRIAALEPDFAGDYPEVKPLEIREADFGLRDQDEALRQISSALAQPVSFGLGEPRMTLTSGEIISAVGKAGNEHLVYASYLLGKLPVGFIEHARNPEGAVAIIYGLLLTYGLQHQASSGEEIRRLIGDKALTERTMKLLTALAALKPEQILPIVDLTVPTLRKQSASSLGNVAQNVEELVAKYHPDSLTAYLLKYLLKSRLGRIAVGKEQTRTPSRTKINESAQRLLALLAHIGSETDGFREKSYQAGASLILPQTSSPVNPPDVRISELDQILPPLAQTPFEFRKKILQACFACIAQDNVVTANEAEMLRLIALALACPLPPFAA